MTTAQRRKLLQAESAMVRNMDDATLAELAASCDYDLSRLSLDELDRIIDGDESVLLSKEVR